MTGLEERLGRAHEYVSFVAFLMSRMPEKGVDEELVSLHVNIAMNALDKALDVMNHIGTGNGPGEN